MLLVGLLWYFFGLFVRPGTNLEKDFLDVTCFLHLLYTRYEFRKRFFGCDMFFAFIVFFVSILLIHYFVQLIFTLHLTLILLCVGIVSIAWC